MLKNIDKKKLAIIFGLNIAGFVLGELLAKVIDRFFDRKEVEACCEDCIFGDDCIFDDEEDYEDMESAILYDLSSLESYHKDGVEDVLVRLGDVKNVMKRYWN